MAIILLTCTSSKRKTYTILILLISVKFYQISFIILWILVTPLALEARDQLWGGGEGGGKADSQSTWNANPLLRHLYKNMENISFTRLMMTSNNKCCQTIDSCVSHFWVENVIYDKGSSNQLLLPMLPNKQVI